MKSLINSPKLGEYVRHPSLPMFIPYDNQNALEALASYELALEARYARDAVFAHKADLIHESRMVPGRACVGCMELAALREVRLVA